MPSEQKIYFEETQGKRKRRRQYFLFVGVVVAVSAVLFGSEWILFQSPLFRLNQVVVRGNHEVSEGEVVDLLKSKALQGSFIKRWLGFRNILTWPSALSADDLRFLPILASAKVQKDYKARVITVDVTEREPYGIWCRKAPDGTTPECLWFDAEGVPFKRTVAAEGNLIRVVNDYSNREMRIGERVLPEQFVPALLSIFDVLGKSDLSLKEVRLDDLTSEEIRVTTYDGPQLYFSLRFPASSALSVIQSLIAKPDFKKLQYIDFRVENRAYYK